MKTTTKPTAKRAYTVRKCVSLTGEMERGLKTLCRDKGIESEGEAIRMAVASFVDRSYSEETLKMQGIHALRNEVEKLTDTLEIIFKYMDKMHLNILGYLPEIETEFKEAAFRNASFRHDKFFNVFQNGLKDDPAFFEKLLARYFREGK
jgi:hypothetical protein